MDWSAPVSTKFAEPLPTLHRVTTFLGHYDCRVYLTDSAYVEVGAGSLPAARHILPEPGSSGCVGRIGRWTEFGDCAVLNGGEHPNDLPVNIVFAQHAVHQGELLATGAADFGRLPAIPVEIGSGVVISNGATVLAGAAIGDGAVIGAGAVVTRPADPFGIYGGVPARKIRERPNAARIAETAWWDFAPDYLIANISRLHELAINAGPHPRMRARPRLVLRFHPDGSVTFLGASDGEATAAAPPKVMAYVSQAFDPSTPDIWLADCWA